MRLPRHLFGAFAALACIALLVGCASVGAPLPPSLELIQPPTDLRAVRKGDKVYLLWTVPTKTMDHQSIRHRGTTLVCRSLQVVMATCDTPVGTIAPDQTPAQQTSVRTQASFVDELPADDLREASTRAITYAVEPLNTSDRSAGLSNQVHVFLAPTIAPPSDFHAELTAEGVRLSWTGEVLSLTESSVTYFYRVYRRSQGTTGRTVVGQVVRGTAAHSSLLDQTIAWEKHYEYWLNVVTDVQSNPHPCPISTTPVAPACFDHTEIEGDDSPVVSVFTHDIYPPAVPSGLQAVFSGPGQAPFIDLLWAPDTDPDLAGYNIYRHEQGQAAVKINSDPVKAPSYRDTRVESGKTYWYAVSAIDLRGNESVHSDEASESVP
jgi:hypothetical protein